MKTLRYIILIVICLMTSGCILGTNTADRARYDQIAPDHALYVQADISKTDEQKDRRLRLLEAWRISVGAPK